MGLFSFLNKNKQDTTAEDSGYYSRDDEDAAATRARSKRASSAGEPAARRGKKAEGAADPVLPEKKRARRRLVGAIALALAVAVGLPMVLDSEPKPLASDISIQIPPREKAAPLPVPAAPAPADSLDQREQFVEPPKAAAAPAAAAPESTDIKTVSIKPEAKAEPKVARTEPKPAEPKPAKVEAKPVQGADDAARALAILEGKPADKTHSDAAGQKFVVQVAALASQEKVNELQGKLKDAGIKSTAQKVAGKSGERIRITVGPFSKEEAEKMRARLDKLGLSGSMVRPHG